MTRPRPFEGLLPADLLPAIEDLGTGRAKVTPKALRPRCGARTRSGKPCAAPAVWDRESDRAVSHLQALRACYATYGSPVALGSVHEALARIELARGNRKAFTVGDLKVTTVDVSGTYVAEVKPGSAERHNKPNYRMRAAVVETPGGPYFVKLTGPAATVGAASAAFDAFLQSMRFK